MLFGETSLMLFWGNIIRGNIILGNIIWGNIIRGNIIWGNIIRGTVIWGNAVVPYIPMCIDKG
jgi:hypothetical protein